MIKVQVGHTKEKTVTCHSLTFGYIYDVEQGVIEENVLSAILNATALSEEEIRDLPYNDTLELWNAIKRETYPQLFDEDGNELVIDSEEDSEEDKKKV
jgi:hypothetical protein